MKRGQVIALIVVGVIILIVIIIIARNLTTTTTATTGGVTTTATGGLGPFLAGLFGGVGGLFSPKDPCKKASRKCDPAKPGWNVSGFPDATCCGFG